MILITSVWGAALYVALFAGPRRDTVYLEPVAAPGRWHPEDASNGDGAGQRRHLNGHTPAPATPAGAKSYAPRVPGTDFSIREPFNFPLPHYSLPKAAILGSPWITQLQRFLGNVWGTQVSMVTASIEHLDILLNWLISANLVAVPPLQNVLVLTLDKTVYDLLTGHNLSTLYVHEDMVISPTANVTRRFSQVHVVRLSVLRLINHYGFTVVNYDCDAIVLRNPQTIFDGHADVDIIGTFGRGPSRLFEKWGITLNTGVMLLRSNAKLGRLVVAVCVVCPSGGLYAPGFT